MTLHLPRLPSFAVDPLIAEAKRRMRRRRALLALLVLLGAGAVAGIAVLAHLPGSPGQPPTAAPAVRTPAEGLAKGGTASHCSAVSRGFRACTVFALTSAAFRRLGAGEVSHIERRQGSLWLVALAPARAPHPGHGWWRRVLPDARGTTVLAQWSGECEVPFTYLIANRLSTLRQVFPSQPVTALGWTSEGLARVKLWKPVYASKTRISRPAGIYLVSPAGQVVRLEKRLPPSRGC